MAALYLHCDLRELELGNGFLPQYLGGMTSGSHILSRIVDLSYLGVQHDLFFAFLLRSVSRRILGANALARSPNFSERVL